MRNIRGEMGLPPHLPVDVILITDKPVEETLIRALIRIKDLRIVKELKEEPPFASTAVVGETKIVIPLPEELREKEKARLVKEKEKLQKQIASLSGQLANENFLARAPKELVDKTKSNLLSTEKKLAEVEKKLT